MSQATPTGAAAVAARRIPSLVWLFLVAAGLVALLYAVRQLTLPGTGMGTDYPAVGTRLSGLEVQPLTGASEAVRLDDLRDRVAVINFWGTWCPPCQREFPHVSALEQEYRGEDEFKLLAVSCGDTGDDSDLEPLRQATSEFLEAHQSSLPTYADPGNHTRQSVAKALGLTGFAYPITLVLDRQGVIRGVWLGYADGTEREIARLIERLL